MRCFGLCHESELTSRLLNWELSKLVISGNDSPRLWARDKVTVRTAPALIVRGLVQNASGAVTVAVDQLEPLVLGEALTRGSRDFR